MHQEHKKFYIWVTVVVILFMVVVIAMWLVVPKSGSRNVSTAPYASAGQIPLPPNLTTYTGILNSSFPPQFIIASGTKIFGSTDNPDPTTGVHTVGAMYATKVSSLTAFNWYINLLSSNGWQILSPFKVGTISALFGINTSTRMTANVRFQATPSFVVVTVSVGLPLKTQ